MSISVPQSFFEISAQSDLRYLSMVSHNSRVTVIGKSVSVRILLVLTSKDIWWFNSLMKGWKSRWCIKFRTSMATLGRRILCLGPGCTESLKYTNYLHSENISLNLTQQYMAAFGHVQWKLKYIE